MWKPRRCTYAPAPRLFLAAAIAILLPLRAAATQGLSGASVGGRVVAGNAPVTGAIVSVVELGTGVLRRTTTGSDGHYSFESLPVGAYRVEARAVGLLPVVVQLIRLHLGDRLRLELVLQRRASTELEKITVRSAVLRNPGAGGPAHIVPAQAIRGLPLFNRDFVGLFAMSSQAVGAGPLSISGQHARFNGIQVDGAIGNDLFGVNVTPGSGSGGKSVSLEALAEVRILIAPFDVRHGGFSGGLINAVTRTGSNDAGGSAFMSHSRSGLVGPDTAGTAVAAFDQLQYGLSAGGPIIRDKLHYFVVAERQSRATRFSGHDADEVQTGITMETAHRAARVFRERYGFDPGGPEAPDLRQPNHNLFAKLTWNHSPSHSVDLAQSILEARSDNFNRLLRTQNNVDGWQLSNSGAQNRSSTSSTRLRAISTFSNLTNEAVVAFSTTDDRVDSRNRVPLFIVEADLPGHYLSAGSTKAAQGTRTLRRTLELTDNLSWRRGAHVLTLGMQNVLFHVRDNFSLGSWGVWTFSSVDALEKGIASRYEVTLPLTPRGSVAEYSSEMLSGYVQDRWRIGSSLEVTGGVRVDLPFFDSPSRNAGLAANEKLGKIDTGVFPTGNPVMAPRIGFAWQTGRGKRSVIRGGAGAFAGRPPLVWMTGAFSGTGEEQTTLTCGLADGVPPPTSDISQLPRSCIRAGRTTLPSVSFFDSDFRFQRAIKYALGVDHDFGHLTRASVDVIHTTSRDNMFLKDVNLVTGPGNAEGRAMYGAISSTGAVTPARLDGEHYGPVFRYDNVDSDRSTSVSVSAQREWGSGGVALMSYSWSRTTDVTSLSGLISSVLFRNNPVDGTLASRNRRRSARDIPHSFVAVAILPVGFATFVSGYFRARSGTPYAFTVRGDANADGMSGNDLVYLPVAPDDISLSDPATYAALDEFIDGQACLRRQRGGMMRRNSCRNPVVATLDGRVAKRFRIGDDRGFELSADVFNLPNMLHRRWGLVRETASREETPLLSLAGWDAARNRPRYSIPVVNGAAVVPHIDRVVTEASRWRVQLGSRLDF